MELVESSLWVVLGCDGHLELLLVGSLEVLLLLLLEDLVVVLRHIRLRCFLVLL